MLKYFSAHEKLEFLNIVFVREKTTLIWQRKEKQNKVKKEGIKIKFIFVKFYLRASYFIVF